MEASHGSTRDPLTLRFRDPSLEHEFQAEMAATNGPQARVGAAVAIGLWLIAALIIPAVIEVDRGVVTVICVGMAGANVVGVTASRWATTLDRQQTIGFALNGLAGLAVLALIAVSGTTDRYAAPALLLIAIFAFVVIRLRFIFALVAAGTYLVGYVVVVAIGPTRGTALDVFLVGAAILAGLAATYLLERGARDGMTFELHTVLIGEEPVDPGRPRRTGRLTLSTSGRRGRRRLMHHWRRLPRVRRPDRRRA